ncbi:MAG: ECF transporter S component [Clostridia bacterium]|nr:ECF transporter S component [Clostridia bacterium]
MEVEEKVQNAGESVPKAFFSAKKAAFMALAVALSYAVSLLEIPMPILGANFLKLDFGNVFIVLISFLLGPVEGVIICFLKEGLRCFTSSSLCAGEIANFLMTSVYLLLPSICYRYKRTLKTVLITLPCACLLATGTALLVNRFLVFPTFSYLFGGSIFGMTVKQAFAAFWPAVLLFNLIKTVSVSVITLLLYKRLSYVWKRFTA